MQITDVLVLLTVWISCVAAKTHTWYYKTGWVDANPDGCFDRKMIGWNDTWPLPILRAKKGDTINLYLTNGFDNANTSVHFHGLFQNGSNQMDGPEFITQCPIPPGETMLYNFTLTQHGTYWYHSHTQGQYGDGMRGVFIIDDDKDYDFDFDEEVTLTLGEHYHDDSSVLLPKFLSRYNPTGAEPIPQNALFNESRNVTWNVEPNKTYFLRIVNVGRFVSQYLKMEDHSFEIVEVDGVFVEKNTTDMIYVTAAQRYGVLVHTKSDTSKNYRFCNYFDTDMLDLQPEELQVNGTNAIVYNKDAEIPTDYMEIDSWEDEVFDDFYLVPVDKKELLPEADMVITLDVKMDNLNDGVNYAFFNDITYTKPKVPILMSALAAGDKATDVQIYGSNTHSFVLNGGETIDIVVNSMDPGKHPFHLHGHTFQLIARGPGVENDDDDPIPFNPDDHPDYPEYPMMRDTVFVNPSSYIVLRFKADNPGVWFFHCHIEWHLDQGLAVVLVEDPIGMQKQETQQLTDDSRRMCEKLNIPLNANAAGNTDWLDLTGENKQVKDLPGGFTARGIVALVFSCICGILGVAMIAYYGMQDIKNVEERVMRDLDVQVSDLEDDSLEVGGSSSHDSSDLRK
ncbi:iron transport multicopper oxidase Fet3p [Diutina catenulata]